MRTLKLILAGSFIITAGAITFSLPSDTSAHEQQLDSIGCHHARNHRNYHCHEGALKGLTFKSRGEAIRRSNRIKAARKKDDDDDGF